MGVITELGYEVKDANAVQRLTQKIAASGPGSWVFQRTLFPIDKWLFRVTKGRVTVPGLLAGLPVILFSTTGAKTGKARTMPLVGVPLGDDMAVIGSNYGQTATPGWVHNLRATPDATVAYRDATVGVTARRADDAETERAFEVASGFYGGFKEYRQRASHREIEVYVLETRAGE
ncbi:MAG: nitroreductase/quinone reductase family protein [Ilumatobacter sp.]